MPDGALGAMLRRRLRSRRVIVRDDSMRPTLLPGDRLWIDPRPGRPYARGDLIVARDPERPGRLVVKRVAAVGGEMAPGLGTLPPHTVYAVGDNPGPSRDSRQFGPLPEDRIAGVAWFRYAPPARRGPLAELK